MPLRRTVMMAIISAAARRVNGAAAVGFGRRGGHCAKADLMTA